MLRLEFAAFKLYKKLEVGTNAIPVVSPHVRMLEPTTNRLLRYIPKKLLHLSDSANSARPKLVNTGVRITLGCADAEILETIVSVKTIPRQNHTQGLILQSYADLLCEHCLKAQRFAHRPPPVLGFRTRGRAGGRRFGAATGLAPLRCHISC